MNLTVDIGNTRVKVGVFSQGELVHLSVVEELGEIEQILSQWEIDKVMVSTVRKDVRHFFENISTSKPVQFLDHHTKVPIVNLYHTPETLGMDRLAVAVGASTLYPNLPSLVIDAGTSITYDFIDQQANYHGGGISPGIDLRFRSLNDHTSKLPLINGNWEEVPLIGNTTESSIRSGVLNGVTSEIEGIIRRYGDKFPNLKVLLCGGDATFFESTIKAPIFVVPHLVLIGLNRILLHHAEG